MASYTKYPTDTIIVSGPHPLELNQLPNGSFASFTIHGRAEKLTEAIVVQEQVWQRLTEVATGRLLHIKQTPTISAVLGADDLVDHYNVTAVIYVSSTEYREEAKPAAGGARIYPDAGAYSVSPGDNNSTDARSLDADALADGLDDGGRCVLKDQHVDRNAVASLMWKAAAKIRQLRQDLVDEGTRVLNLADSGESSELINLKKITPNELRKELTKYGYVLSNEGVDRADYLQHKLDQAVELMCQYAFVGGDSRHAMRSWLLQRCKHSPQVRKYEGVKPKPDGLVDLLARERKEGYDMGVASGRAAGKKEGFTAAIELMDANWRTFKGRH